MANIPFLSGLFVALLAACANGEGLEEIGCFVKGQCHGQALAQRNEETIEGCLQFCKEQKDCNYFTYFPDLSYCIAFQTCTSVDEDQCPSCQSGDFSCTYKECFEPGFCNGDLITAVQADSAEECLDQCTSLKECNWFTWDQSDNACLLTTECNHVDDQCDSCVHGQRECAEGDLSTCGGVLQGPRGSFTTPNYPDVYPTYRQCEWNITVAEDKNVKLTFTDFELYSYAEVLVFDGHSFDFVVFNSDNVPQVPVFSYRNEMQVIFDAGPVAMGRGFRVEYTEDDTCLRPLYGPNGTFSTPNYPNQYGTDECEWNITTIAGSKVELTFIDFETAPLSDYVHVYDGHDINSPLLLSQSGLRLPRAVVSSGNKMLVKFLPSPVDQKRTTYKGFLAKYRRVFN